LEPTPQELQYTNAFAHWEDSLRGEFRGQLRVRLVRVEKGNFGNSHGVGEGVSELIFKDRPGSRVYFGRSGNKVILLTGGDKSSQQKDVAQAKKMWREINGH
jgi:putative addiction module killer protein